MSEITVTVPLSFFGAAGISPEGLQSIETLKAEKEQFVQANRNLATQMATWAKQLQITLDGDFNMMDKFRMLREISSEATRFTNQFLSGEPQ